MSSSLDACDIPLPDDNDGPECQSLALNPNDLAKLHVESRVEKRFQIRPNEMNLTFGDDEQIRASLETWNTPNRPVGRDISEYADFVKLKEEMQPVPGVPGTYKRVLEAGAGQRPEVDHLVHIDYEMFQPGMPGPVDSSYLQDRKQMFRVGRGVVIPALDHLVRTMQMDEHAEFYVEPEAAYDRLGSLDNASINSRIRKGQPIRLTVHLLDVVANRNARRVYDLTVDERNNLDFHIVFQAALEEKTEGDKWIAKCPSKAPLRYRYAIEWLSRRTTEEEAGDERKKRDLLARLCCNTSLALLKKGASARALARAKEAADHALAAGSSGLLVKAWYRAASASLELQKFEEALALVDQALDRCRSDEDLRTMLGLRGAAVDGLRKFQNRRKNFEKKMAQGLLGRGGRAADPTAEVKRGSMNQPESKSVNHGGLDKDDEVKPDVREYVIDELIGLALDQRETQWMYPPEFNFFEREFVKLVAEQLRLEVRYRAGEVPNEVSKPRGYRAPSCEEIQAIMADQRAKMMTD